MIFQHNLIVIFLNISSNRNKRFLRNKYVKFDSFPQYFHYSYSHNWHKRDKNKSISPWLAKQASIHSADSTLSLPPRAKKEGKLQRKYLHLRNPHPHSSELTFVIANFIYFFLRLRDYFRATRKNKSSPFENSFQPRLMRSHRWKANNRLFVEGSATCLKRIYLFVCVI